MTAPTLDGLITIISNSASGIEPDTPMTGETLFKDLGINSLSLLNIMIEAATEYEIDLSEMASDMAPPSTPNELLKILTSFPQ